MIAAMILLAYAVVVAIAGTWWLPRAGWPLRVPRLGVIVWQALSLTVVGSGVLAALLLAAPCLEISVGPGGPALRADVPALHAEYATAGGLVIGLAGGILALVLAGRMAWVTCRGLAHAARRRARHYDALALVARPGPAPGLLVLDDEHAAAYCLPGRRRIVLTTGALRSLDSRQLYAVLAHERAHLASRHHLVLAFAAALRASFPRIPLFAVAAEQISRLVEMAADDAALRQADRLTLAGALLALAAARPPAGALGAGGTAAAQRIRRLLDSPCHLSAGQRVTRSAAVLAAAAALALSAPALAVLGIPHCPAHPGHAPATASAGQPPR